MATTTWGFEEEADTRPRFRVVDNEDQAENEEPSQAAYAPPPAPTRSWVETWNAFWHIARASLCFAIIVAAVVAQTWVNYTQHVERGVPWVIFSVLSAVCGTWAFSSLAAGHLRAHKRILMFGILAVAVAFDMSNNSANVATLNSKQHAVADASLTGKGNADDRRARLKAEIEAADVAAGRKPVGELEAEFRVADEKAIASSWVTHTNNKGRRYTVHGAENSRLRQAATLLDGKVKSAREREEKTKELQGVPVLTAVPAATDVTVEALTPMFAAVGMAGKNLHENSVVTSWFYGTVFLIICLVTPWVAQTYLQETLDPEFVRNEWLENLKQREMRREVKRAGKAEQKRCPVLAQSLRRWGSREMPAMRSESTRRPLSVFRDPLLPLSACCVGSTKRWGSRATLLRAGAIRYGHRSGARPWVLEM